MMRGMGTRLRRTLLIATALLGLAVAAGCGDGGNDPPAATARTTTAAAPEPGAGTEAHNTAPPAKLTGRRVHAGTFTVPLPVGYRDASHDRALKDAPVKPDLV